MRCFIHNNVEAIATCKICGKAMCADCSAYSSHSGICPQCRKEQFTNEVDTKLKLIYELEREMTKRIWYTILTGITIIGLFYNIYKYNKASEEKLNLESRVTKLKAEIKKLDSILANRGGKAFV